MASPPMTCLSDLEPFDENLVTRFSSRELRYENLAVLSCLLTYDNNMAFQIKYDVKFHKCYESRLPRRNNVTVHHEISDFSGVSVELTVFNNCKNNNYYYIVVFLNSSLYFWTDRFDSVVMVQLSNLVQSYVSAYRSEQQKFGKLCSVLTQK